MLNTLTQLLPQQAAYGQEIARRVRDRKTAVAAQRICCSLDMALEMLVIVNEVTINRGVEPGTELLPDGTAKSESDLRGPTGRADTQIAIHRPKLAKT